ncbi:MAG: hypothetical protein ABW022_10950 [Actinoplanes sp.]
MLDDLEEGEELVRKSRLISVHDPDWELFQEVYGKGNVSARIRELVRKDLERYTREEIKAQSLAGLTEG